MKVVPKISAQCHCGAVRIDIAQLPTFMNDCNCSLCRKSGGVWGYYCTDDVQVTGTTSSYSRIDRDEPAVRVHYCGNCGNTTHWTLSEAMMQKIDGPPQMGVNMRLFSVDQLSGVELRFPDGANWDGKTDYTYRRESAFLD